MTTNDRKSSAGASPPDSVEGQTEVFGRLVEALVQSNVSFVHLHHRAVFTSSEAAEARGTTLHSGAKALIVKAGDDFRMTVMPADLSLHSNALRKLLGCKRLRFATKDELKTLTGLPAGSIPPFGSMFGFETICDQRLSENERINFNAGSNTESLQMDYEEYVRFESPRIADIARSSASPRG